VNKLRTEKITWKRKCKTCGNYFLKKDLHGLSKMCNGCRKRLNVQQPQCNAITRQGTRCSKTAYCKGYCKQHLDKYGMRD
jgi:hypothetical protein